MNNLIRSVVKDTSAETVLDVGCGTMVRLDKLPVKPDHYTGTDVSSKAIQIAQEKFPKATFFVADASSDALPQADVVTAIDVMPHIKKGHFYPVVSKLFRSANKAVVIKTSLGVDDGFYQNAHDWGNGTIPNGWSRVDMGPPPDNSVARLWVFRKQEVGVAA